jgi:hypothetical protein
MTLAQDQNGFVYLAVDDILASHRRDEPIHLLMTIRAIATQGKPQLWNKLGLERFVT